MAFTSGGSGAGPVSDINVTPLVDVMLVLLIIFMVTAPLVQAGIKVDLPNAEAPQMPSQETRLQVTVGHENPDDPRTPVGVWVGQDRVTLERLGEVLRANVIVQRDHEAYVSADQSVPYGTVVRVLGIMRSAGVEKLGIVTDPVASQ
jgi:biopolymer transport protein TolR